MNSPITRAQLVVTRDSTLQCQGAWTHQGLTPLQTQWQQLQLPTQLTITVDGAALTALDTAGAWLLDKLVSWLTAQHKQVILANFNEQYLKLYKVTCTQAGVLEQQPIQAPTPHTMWYRLGQLTVNKGVQTLLFLSYTGELCLNFLAFAKNPWCFQWRNMLYNVQQIGFMALPIVGLLSFLIGIVLTYQMGLQLKSYGANIFIVDLAGLAILREFGPLITAIITAGRTSSAFTAQLGLMKANEEIAALRTMGLSPLQRLVLPKVIATLIAIPLLIMWANLFGVLGSMVMADTMLSISYTDFLTRFGDVIGSRTFWIGMSKAPVFALIISTVGCFQGFSVASNADSVGRYTTKSVVQAIFLIVIADAIFSIIFSWRNM